MAGFDLTAADPIMKINFAPLIAKQHNTAAVLMNQLGLGAGIPISNRGYEIPVHFGGNADFAWFPEGGAMPAGQGQDLTRSTVYHKRFALSVLFTGDALDLTPNDAVSYARTLGFNTKNATVDAIKWLNIYSFLDGSGQLSLANANNQDLSSTVTPASVTVDNNRYLRPRQFLEVHDGSTSTVLGVVQVQTVAKDGVTITTLAISGSALNDVDIADGFYSPGSYNATLTGLDALVDNTDVSGGVQGIDRGDYPNWQANVITLTGSPALSRDHLHRSISSIEISRGSVDRGALQFWSHPSQLHAYMSMGWPMKRFTGGGATKLDLGFTAYEFEGVPWVIDTDCPRSVLYALDPSSMFKVIAKELGFDDRTGNILRQVPSNTAGRYDDKFVAYIVYRGNMGIYTPNSNTKVEGLAITSGY